MEYQILGQPIPLKRPRFSGSKVYNSQKSEMLLHYLSIKNQHGKQSLFSDPIHLDVTFIFQVPLSYTKKKQETLLNKPHQGRPDLDNLLKYVMDICTGALYTDDRIVTSISAEKIYGLHPKTIFTVTKL